MDGINHVHFAHYTMYDPIHDRHYMRMTAITDIGAYWADVPTTNSGDRRRAFKEHVLTKISLGQPPDEVVMG